MHLVATGNAMGGSTQHDVVAGHAVTRLWWLPLLAGALPLAGIALAFPLAVGEGQFPACNPLIDGCVSISRAARHGLPNHLFRALLLPAAVLQDPAGIAPAVVRPPADAQAVSAEPAAAAPPVVPGRAMPVSSEIVPLWQVERDAIEAAIARFDGNIPRAAAALEISPSTIYRKRQAWAEAGLLTEQPA